MRQSYFVAIAIISTIIFWGCYDDLDINDSGNLVPKTVDQDASLPSITINGTQLHSETFGNPSDPMLVFLHGGPGGDYRNGLNVKQLANDGFYVVFYDQRGSGLSKRHDFDSYTINIMFDDLAGVIEHYRTSPSQKVFLFGHSWGGILAAGYIDKYPTEISGAIIAEAGGFTWDLLEAYGEKSRKLSLWAEHTSDILYKDQFLTGKKNDHAVLDYKLNISASYTYAKGNDEGIEGPSPSWRNGAVVLNSLASIAERDGYDFTKNLHRYNAKVLFLYSELNKSYGLASAQEEAAYFSSHQITEIKGTGHELIHFKWSDVYPVVQTYLNSLK